MSNKAAEVPSEGRARESVQPGVPPSNELLKALFDKVVGRVKHGSTKDVFDSGKNKFEIKRDRNGGVANVMWHIDRGDSQEDMYCFDRNGKLLLSQGRDVSKASDPDTLTKRDATPLDINDVSKVDTDFILEHTSERVADVVG